tara:strand:- start:1043 stop:1978 length:936 start_codon:yes stop_codon:yes gene_type:complete
MDIKTPDRKHDKQIIKMLQDLQPDGVINKDDIKKIYLNYFDKFWESKWFGLEYSLWKKPPPEGLSPSFFFFYNDFDLSFKDTIVDRLKDSYGPYINELTGVAMEYDSINSKGQDSIFVRLRDGINAFKVKSNFIRNFTKTIPGFKSKDTDRIIKLFKNFDGNIWLGNFFGRNDPYLRTLLINDKSEDISNILDEIEWSGNKDKLMEIIKATDETDKYVIINGIQMSFKNDTDDMIGIELRGAFRPVLLAFLVKMGLAQPPIVKNILSLPPTAFRLISHVKIVFDKNGFKDTKIYFAYPNPSNLNNEDIPHR